MHASSDRVYFGGVGKFFKNWGLLKVVASLLGKKKLEPQADPYLFRAHEMAGWLVSLENKADAYGESEYSEHGVAYAPSYLKY